MTALLSAVFAAALAAEPDADAPRGEPLPASPADVDADIPEVEGAPPEPAALPEAGSVIPEAGPVIPEAAPVIPELPPSPTPAKRGPKVKLRATGHVKSFGIATFPYESALLPSDPQGQGILDARLALSLDVSKVFHVEVAHAITPRLGGAGSALSIGRSGVGVVGNETVKLSWSAFGQDSFAISGRTDRLLMRFKLPHVDLTLGRQPITFGTGTFFTPLDLVNPFTPTTVDTEVKPGVDAVRVDAYAGFSTRITAVAAYIGDPDTADPEAPTATDGSLSAFALALAGQGTVGVTDLGGFYGLIHGDHVLGLTVATGVGPVALHGDAALTIASKDSDDGVFFRGVLGAGGLVTPTTSLSGELYVQTFGITDASQVLTQFSKERYRRSEVWLAGLAYYGLAVSQEIVPVVHVSFAVIGSLTEPSVLLTPGLQWSIADNADLGVGGFIGVGARPEPTLDNLLTTFGVRSEFGTYSGVAFVQLRSWF